MLVLLFILVLLLWTKLKASEELVFWGIFMSVNFVIAFFFGLTQPVSAILLFVAFGLRIYKAERKWDKENTIALLLALPFLFTASMPTRFLDAGTYYEQSARWFEHGIPLGLGNFDIFLMQSSMAHSNEALVNNLLSVGQNDFTVLISTLLIALSFARIRKSSWTLAAVGFIVFGVLVHFAQASSTDLMLIALAVFYLLERKSNERGVWELLVLIVILPFIKPVGAGISVLFAYELWRKTRFKYIWTIAIAGLAYIGKGFWVSGWLPVLGKMSANFSIPIEAKSFLKFTQTFFEYEGRDKLPFNVDLLFGLGYFILITFQAIKRRQQKQEWLPSFIIQLAILSFWVFKTPAARYLLPFYLIAFIEMPFEKSIQKLEQKTVILGFAIIGLLSVLPNWSQWITDVRAQRFLGFGGISNVQWLTPSPLWKPETKAVKIEGDLTANIPIEPFLCFDAAFPCNPRLARYYGGDSIYLPVFHADSYSFSYKAILLDADSERLLDSLSILPQLQFKEYMEAKKLDN